MRTRSLKYWVWANSVTSLNYLQSAALKTIYWTPINSSGINHNGCFMSNFIMSNIEIFEDAHFQNPK